LRNFFRSVAAIVRAGETLNKSFDKQTTNGINNIPFVLSKDETILDQRFPGYVVAANTTGVAAASRNHWIYCEAVAVVAG
jgi:hypothetical protein